MLEHVEPKPKTVKIPDLSASYRLGIAAERMGRTKSAGPVLIDARVQAKVSANRTPPCHSNNRCCNCSDRREQWSPRMPAANFG